MAHVESWTRRNPQHPLQTRFCDAVAQGAGRWKEETRSFSREWNSQSSVTSYPLCVLGHMWDMSSMTRTRRKGAMFKSAANESDAFQQDSSKPDFLLGPFPHAQKSIMVSPALQPSSGSQIRGSRQQGLRSKSKDPKPVLKPP